MRRELVAVGWGLSVLLSACSAGTDEGSSPFDGPTVGQPVGSATAPGDGDGDESSTGEASGDDDGGESTGPAMDPTGVDPTDAASTGMPDMPADTGTDTGGVNPPQTGMYGDCLVPQDCMAPTNVCIVVNDTAGFCTNMACSNPATDCEPTPGGTATPICFPIELNGMAASSCALSCAAGETCPAGMTCWPLEQGSICA